MNKRLLSLLLALLMVVSLVPTAAFAAVGDGEFPVEPPAAEEDAAQLADELPAEPAEAQEPGADDPVATLAETELGENLCRPSDTSITVSATASSVEVPSLSADKVIDGNTTGNASRWSSNADENKKDEPQWIQIDLGTVRDVGTVKLFWERNNVFAYNVKLSENALTDEQWDEVTPIYNHPASEGRITVLTRAITLAQTQRARYVRVSILSRDDFGEGAAGYFNATMYEIEVYSSTQEVDPLEGMTKISTLDYVTATASGVEGGTDFTPDKVFDGNTSGNANRWSSQNSATDAWIILDLHRLSAITGIRLYWQRNNATAYTLDLSADGQTWKNIHTCESRITNLTETFTFKSVPGMRYVRIYCTGHDDPDHGGAYVNISLFEVEVYGTAGDLVTPDGNLCRPSDGVPVTATASSHETGNVTADKAIDGGFTNADAGSENVERWASETTAGGQWLQIDLGAPRTVSTIKIFWQHDSVTAYNVQISSDNAAWETVYTHTTGRISNQLEKLIVFEPKSCRYIKINATAYDNQGSETWGNVSIWEVEAYRDQQTIVRNAATVLDELNLTATSFEITGGKLALKNSVDVPDDYVLTFAANLEQVVAADGTVFTPLVNKDVKLDVTLTNRTDPSDKATTGNRPITFTVPGANGTNAGNPKPAVVPEIMEWYSSAEQVGQIFTLTKGSRIIHRAGFDPVAKELDADLAGLFPDLFSEADAQGNYVTHVHSLQTYDDISTAVQAGDIVIYNVLPGGTAANLGKTVGFDRETYRMDITDHVTIYATDATGAYWATRTLLQALKLSGDHTVAQGSMRDYPEFKVRSFVLDVGRKPMSMDKLRQMAKNMAWYKMNDFHVHLNDNLIFMEDYGVNSGNYTDPATYAKANKAYSAFRLQSGLKEEADAVAPLSAKDYHYTKAEYKAFVEDSAKMGVTIVSEIDVPAHAKAIVDAFPSVRLVGASGHPWNDHLDLTHKYEQSLAVVKKIFDEYIDEGVFGPAVHFGADEYYDSHPAYRRFVKDMIVYLNGKANVKTKRVWGSLTFMSNDQTQYPTAEIPSAGIQMNVWDSNWARPQDMYDLGFDIINTIGGYIVPQSGSYGDKFGSEKFDFTPNVVGGQHLPASSPQMLGAAYAIWNDCIDTKANGIDEQDIFERFFGCLPYYGCALWGKSGMTKQQAEASVAVLSYAPNTNPTNEVELAENATKAFDYAFLDCTDSSGNGRDLTLGGSAEIGQGLLHLQGGASYAEIGLDRLPWGSQLSFRAMKLPGGSGEQVLFEGDHAYGDFAIKAIPVDGDETKWKLGFSRELYDFVFEDTLLPVGEWVDITLTSEERATYLSVDGDPATLPTGYFRSNENSNTQFKGNSFLSGTASGGIKFGSSFSIPVARIGSRSNAFVGYVDNVHTGDSFPSSPIEDPKNIIPGDQYQGALAGNHQPGDDASKAIDEDPSTVWHTVHSSVCPDADGWIQIELKQAKAVGGLSYLPRPQGTNGTIKTFDILVSDNGTDWTSVLEDGSFSGTRGWMTAAFPAQTTKFVRLLAKDTYSDSPYRFVSAAELRLLRALGNLADAEITLPASAELVDGVATVEVTVTMDGAPLFADRDYTVTYRNNTGEGTATVIITGAGGYAGKVEKTFQVTAPPAVEPVDLADAAVTFPEESYPLDNGKAEPKPVVKLGDVTLLEGIDYTVTYARNTAVGEATVTVTGMGAYEGTKTATFTVAPAIVKKNLSNTAKTKVTLHQLTFLYSGAAITPDPVVTYEGETLVKGKHYTVSYRNNNAVGEATVTVTGLAPYCTGSASAAFTIIDSSAIQDLSDVEKTKITFHPAEYPYTGSPITPTFTVRYNGVVLTKGTHYTVELSNNVKGGTGVLVIRGIPEGGYAGPFVATFTITGGATSADPGSGSSSGGSGSSGGSTVSSKLPDGASMTTRTDADGGMSATVTYPSGAKVSADIPVTGPVTAVVTVPAGRDAATVVTIPTREAPTQGHVAVILHPDGTQEIVKTALPTASGVTLALDASATVQVVDNTRAFVDVPADHWAKEAVTFVTSREIFNGTGNSTFSPSDDMSRAMVCTVLANLAGEDTTGGETWYEKAVSWAVEHNVSDGTIPNAIITREQLAAMLYRYAGAPETEAALPDRFRDLDNVSDWAQQALAWAVENDLLRGRSSLDGLDLAPKDTATRAEVAAVFQRYVALLK